MIKLNVSTHGKKDAIGFLPADLVANLPTFTGRKDRTEVQIQKMVDSLLSEGQLQDVVYRLSFDRKPILIAGVTRALAADRINKQGLTDATGHTYSETNPFILTGRYKLVTQDRDGELAALIMTWFENADETRTPMTPSDVVEFIGILSENYNLTDAQIAEKLRQEPAWVAARKRLTVLDSTTMEMLDTGKIDFNTAVTALEIAPEDRSTVFAAAATTAKGKITTPALAAAARTTGAKTAKTLKRTPKEFNTWLDAAIDNTAAGPVQSFLYGLKDFQDGKINEDVLNTMLLVLEGEDLNEEEIGLAAGM